MFDIDAAIQRAIDDQDAQDRFLSECMDLIDAAYDDSGDDCAHLEDDDDGDA